MFLFVHLTCNDLAFRCTGVPLVRDAFGGPFRNRVQARLQLRDPRHELHYGRISFFCHGRISLSCDIRINRKG